MFRVLMSIVLLVSIVGAKMPDKVGNGGAVWACTDANKKIYDIHFIDVFEARNEFLLNVPEITIAPLEAVQAKKLWIQSYLPASEQGMIKEIQTVETGIIWLTGVEMTDIPDVANKVKPSGDSCTQGTWIPTQMMNYTEDGRILGRKDLFDSPFMSDLERAAVYLHEGIYAYLRLRDNDPTSVRSRAIVGYLLAELPNDQKAAEILKILNTKPEEKPVETQPGEGFICGLKPDSFSPIYLGEAKDQGSAKTAAVDACKKGENPFGKADGDFPGFGGGVDFSPQCQQAPIFCEAFTGESKITCSFKTSHEENEYSANGRTEMEAKSNAMAKCMTTQGEEHTCFSGDHWVCK